MKVATTRSPSRRRPDEPGSTARASLLALGAAALPGCNRAPSQNILGSYFPSWMLCALGGILLSALLRQLLSRLGIDAFIPARPLIYAALAGAMTFLIWLLWLGN